MKALDRRQFFRVMGGGLFVFFSTESPTEAQYRRTPSRPALLSSDFNAFLQIKEDGRVACFTGKVELGQGIITSLAQMLAEELDVSVESVDMVMGDTDLCPYDAGTYGSRTTKYFGPQLREAGAQARAILLGMAAARLDVPPARLTISEGVVQDPKNPGKKVSYADLVRDSRIEKKVEVKAELKSPPAFKVSGKSTGRTDGLAKVTGQAKYAGDIRLPDMLYARILRPPAHGAVLKNVDTSAAEKIPGLKIVREGNLVAVLHSLPDQAEKGLALIKAQFTTPPIEVDEKTLFAHLLKVAPGGSVISQEGSLEKGEQSSSRRFEENYFQHYVAHAPMETHTALAHVEGKKATVWASTQTPFGVKDSVARALSLSSEDVRVITPFVGGGFGGKTWNQQAVEAALLAKRAGKPVQVAWTRDEEFFHDAFMPAAVITIRSGLDSRGRIAFWDYRVYFAGDRGAVTFYDLPSHRTSVHGSWWGGSGVHPFNIGAWRAPGTNTNTFARESHMDLMAIAAKADPLVFRLAHLNNPRMRRVLEEAARSFGWADFSKKPGRGKGIACADYLGTYVAAAAEVEVDPKKGGLQVRRLVCAQDMGQVINPEGARMQIEGCLMMGLGYALSEEIRFRGGEILDRNFDTYQIPLFSWMPKIETVLVENQDLTPQGGGEPAITCMGAVLANALYDAVGVRLFELPMTPERIREAMDRATKKLPRSPL
jgi:CO/xanthine dehydrogenase Mo-binding subunit